MMLYRLHFLSLNCYIRVLHKRRKMEEVHKRKCAAGPGLFIRDRIAVALYAIISRLLSSIAYTIRDRLNAIKARFYRA